MLGAISVIWEVPGERGLSIGGETLATELNLESSNFVFYRQPDMFCLGQVHLLLSSDLTREKSATELTASVLKKDPKHKRLKERFLIGRNGTNCAVLSCFILFRRIKQHSFNLLCVLDLFSERWQSTLLQIFLRGVQRICLQII